MPRGLRARPVQHEKHEQANIVQLARVLGARVYVIGTRRSRGKACPKCGTFVAEDQGTRQTPGHADLLMFWPTADRPKAFNGGHARRILYWEAKRASGGRLSVEQREFLQLADEAGVSTGTGDYDDFVAWVIHYGYAEPHQFPHYRTSEART
jgi:hypothetical protein